jgi:hypothetical protein
MYGEIKRSTKFNFFKKILCCASLENARQTYMFVMRRRKTHGKEIVFVVRLVLAHGKGNAQANGCERG